MNRKHTSVSIYIVDGVWCAVNFEPQSLSALGSGCATAGVDPEANGVLDVVLKRGFSSGGEKQLAPMAVFSCRGFHLSPCCCSREIPVGSLGVPRLLEWSRGEEPFVPAEITDARPDDATRGALRLQVKTTIHTITYP